MRNPETISRTARRVVAAGLILASCTSADKSTSDGCTKFPVYSQNRFAPYGTAIREEPDVLSDKVGSFAPNEVISADGWYDSGAPIYPTNSSPWDSSVWFRLAYDNMDGWVSFPGVRATPSTPDETGGFSEYGGEPVVLLPECEIQL